LRGIVGTLKGGGWRWGLEWLGWEKISRRAIQQFGQLVQVLGIVFSDEVGAFDVADVSFQRLRWMAISSWDSLFAKRISRTWLMIYQSILLFRLRLAIHCKEANQFFNRAYIYVGDLVYLQQTC